MHLIPVLKTMLRLSREEVKLLATLAKRYGTARNTETTNESAKQTTLLEERLGILGALADIFK